MTRDPTHAAYSARRTVAFYAGQSGLQAAEASLFKAYVKPGLDVLDLGVGGGRTTAHLSATARTYVGVDYSEAMTAHCRAAFPGLRFETLDATHMPLFADGSFDLVVFSFNGIDSIPTRAGRRSCLRECARVLRPGGVLLFSVHNARYLFFTPVFAGAGPARRLWRLLYAALHSAGLLLLRLPSRAFRQGAGRVRDFGTHGGLPIHVAVPERQIEELHGVGLRVERVLPGPSPEPRPRVLVPWYYYACVKDAQTGAAP